MYQKAVSVLGIENRVKAVNRASRYLWVVGWVGGSKQGAQNRSDGESES